MNGKYLNGILDMIISINIRYIVLCNLLPHAEFKLQNDHNPYSSTIV